MTTESFVNQTDQCRKCLRIIDARVAPFNGNLGWAQNEHVWLAPTSGGHGDSHGEPEDYFRHIPASQFAAIFKEALAS